jgi:hypothetical protein
MINFSTVVPYPLQEQDLQLIFPFSWSYAGNLSDVKDIQVA